MRLAGAAVAQSNYILASDNIFAACKFKRQRFVERWDGSEVECVKALYGRKASGTNAALDHAPFTIDEFEFG